MLDELKRRFPWPKSRPEVQGLDHGWFHDDCQRVFRNRLTADTQTIVELGSWLGMSTRFFLEHAPNATVVCIDHWRGSKEHQTPKFAKVLPVLYQTFLCNLWDHRKRVIPIRTDTVSGMSEVFDSQIVPDLIYVDASHEAADVEADLRTAMQYFPDALIVGDDWSPYWAGVKTGVQRALSESTRQLVIHGVCYEILP